MRRARHRSSGFLIAALAAVGACGELDNITTVKDLRVLAVRAETPGFLVNLDTPGMVADPAELQSTMTALVVDPTTGGEEVTFVAFGCPDYLDAITAATGQTTRVCPSPNAPPPPGLPPPLAAVLATKEITTTGSSLPTDTTSGGIEYQPVIPTFGLTPEQVGLFFTPQPAIPQLDQTISYNRDFGVDVIVDMTFSRGGQQASAIKRLVYWPDLRAEFPAQIPNRNPSIDHIEFYRSRDETTGELLGKWDTMPVVSVSARDTLFVLPVLPEPRSDVVEMYPLRVRNTATGLVETKIYEELLVFRFYATAGTFTPDDQENMPPIFDPSARIRLDSQLSLPGPDKIPASGVIDIWVVVQDERAGSGWLHASVMIVP
jgi:hypothetical protein